jgi:hypothetical protein
MWMKLLLRRVRLYLFPKRGGGRLRILGVAPRTQPFFEVSPPPGCYGWCPIRAMKLRAMRTNYHHEGAGPLNALNAPPHRGC